MSSTDTLFRVLIIQSLLMLALVSGHAYSADPLGDNAANSAVPGNAGTSTKEMTEPYSTGWSFYIDNDIFSPSPRDQDYTGGMSATIAGQRAADIFFSTDPLLGLINKTLGLAQADPGAGVRELHSLQVGLAAFTPGDISISGITPGDRPYSSLVYVANSRLTLDSRHPDTVQQTTLIVGVLGTALVPKGQEIFHELIGSEQPNGWDHQISDGGEPTFRYSYALQHLLVSGGDGTRTYEIKPSFEAGVGYVTDANVALSARWGRISTPWWSFAPDRSEYFAQPSTGLARDQPGSPREFYVWAGAKLKARPYNAFLQGQFRHSDLTYDRDEVRPVLLEAWVGVTGQVSRNYWLSWVLRYQTSELRTEPGDRNMVWGSVFINRYF